MQTCKVCGHEQDNDEILAKDLMYHNDGEFLYKRCEHCGCIWLDIIPDNLADYYNNTSIAGGDGYNSFISTNRSIIKKFLRKERNRYGIINRSIIGRIIYNSAPLPVEYTKIGQLELQHDAKILDIGCGSGALINDLQQIGFSNVKGIDAFIEKEQKKPVVIEKYDIIEYERVKDKSDLFDMIMMHHSFEHIENSVDTLLSINKRLKNDGILFLALPVAGAGVGRYKENWFALCAPYHFYLFGIKSLQILAERTGFEIQSIDYDDSHLWYCKSELYKKNVTFSEVGFNASEYFSQKEIDELKILSQSANSNSNGDCAVLVLKKKLVLESK